MQLIVVESSGKQQFVADLLRKASLDEWTVVSCGGHYCGLPKAQLGIDSKTYAFTWKVRNIQAFERVKKAVAASDAVYAAMDLSPEGEALAHQVSITAGHANKPFYRLRMTSLDVESLQASIDAPAGLDSNQLQGYLSREASDRLFHFVLSQTLADRLGDGLQLNRIGLPLLSELARVERKIRRFKPRTHYVVRALLSDGSTAESGPLSASKADEVVRRAKVASPAFTRARELNRAEPPFTLSALIQFASKRYGIDALTCLKTCETLYSMGLVTYPYTDSCALSGPAASQIHKYASESLSDSLVSKEPTAFSSDRGSLEAIRPVHVSRVPSKLDLSGDLKCLYSAIWLRAVGSQGKPAQVEVQKCTYSIDDEEAFQADGLFIIEAGWHQLSGRLFEPVARPLEPDAHVVDATVLDRQSRAPTRHTHGTLVSWLDEHCLGRPWTYRSAIEFLHENSYVETLGGGLLKITDKGEAVLTFVRLALKDLLDPDSCAELEEDIVAVEQGHVSLEQFVGTYWNWVDDASQKMSRKSLCPKFTSPSGDKLKVLVDSFGRPYVTSADKTWRSFVTFDEKGRIILSPEETDLNRPQVS